MVLVNLLSFSAYAIVAPFLPFELKRMEIDQTWMGYIISNFSLGVIVFSPIVGKMISRTSKKSLVIATGLLCMGLSFINFALLSYLTD